MRILLILTILTISGCHAHVGPTPADRVSGETFRYDCCNPGLDVGTKEMCKWAAEDEDHILWDDDGNKYEFIWSDCEIGKEPWRKYE